MTSEGSLLTEIHPKSGERVFKGTSVPVGQVWRYLDCGDEEGSEIARFLEAYPEVSREQLEAWLLSKEEQRLHSAPIRAAQDRQTKFAALLAFALLAALMAFFVWVCLRVLF